MKTIYIKVMEERNMYTLESLNAINRRFTNCHGDVNASDLEKVNKYIDLISVTRNKNIPQVGDVIEYTDEHGNYFPTAHIEEINTEENTVHICERANSYISTDVNEKNIICHSSGGAWHFIPLDKLTYKGMQEHRFWFFGHCGACADGGIDFYTEVNLWEYDVNKEPYSTKTHNKHYLSYSKKHESGYHWFLSSFEGSGYRAWKTEKELQAWLRTNRAFINNGTVWTYKEVKHHVSPTEFESINAPVDCFLMNGNKRQCKRVYDDSNYTIHLYYVWYYEDDSIEFYARMEKQNQEIEMYTYAEPENRIALEELRSGNIKPLDLGGIKQ